MLAIDFAALLGPTYQVEVNLLGQVFDLPLPAHMTLGLELQGLPITVKPGYDVTGPAGLRNAWALGGKVELSLLGELLGGIGSLEELVLALFPAFSALQHGLRPAFEVFPLPLVADADDRDRDGDLVELRPDWANLPDLDLAPDQPQTLALEVLTPQPPSLDGTPLSTVVVVAGGFSGLGFTPLGLSAAQASGTGAELVMRLAPAHIFLLYNPIMAYRHSLETFLEILRQQIPSLSENFRVETLEVFGSYVRASKGRIVIWMFW